MWRLQEIFPNIDFSNLNRYLQVKKARGRKPKKNSTLEGPDNEEKSTETPSDAKKHLVSKKETNTGIQNAFVVKNKCDDARATGCPCESMCAKKHPQKPASYLKRPTKFEPVETDSMTPARMYKIMMEAIDLPATISNLIANENTMSLIISDHLHKSIFQQSSPETDTERRSFFLSVYNCDLFDKSS